MLHFVNILGYLRYNLYNKTDDINNRLQKQLFAIIYLYKITLNYPLRYYTG